MTYARGLDRDDDFVTGRRRIRQFGVLKRMAEVDDLIALQPGVLLDIATPTSPPPHPTEAETSLVRWTAQGSK